MRGDGGGWELREWGKNEVCWKVEMTQLMWISLVKFVFSIFTSEVTFLIFKEFIFLENI